MYKIISFIRVIIIYYKDRIKYRNISPFDIEAYNKKGRFWDGTVGSHIFMNLIYGNYKAINDQKASHFHFLSDYAEHGIVFSESPGTIQTIPPSKINKIKNIYTFSDRRCKIIRNYLETTYPNICNKIKLHAIGPYILHVNSFYNEKELNSIKNKLGKTLIVFPVHSLFNVEVSYDWNSFIQDIKNAGKEFNSIIICLHFIDVINGKAPLYEKQGFKVVTAGYSNDPLFINRLKSIIEISDMTMSNALGTHIGYSIALNRPHYFCGQNISHNCTDKNVSYQANYEEIENNEKKRITQTFIDLFGKISFHITEEQKDIVKKYWGTF